MGDIDAAAQEIADEVIDNFSTLHPHIRMNWPEWRDLHEMIEREVIGHLTDTPMYASDLRKRDGKVLS